MTRPVLYVIACGGPPAGQVADFVRFAQGQGWDTAVIATPDGVKFLDTAGLAELTGHPVRTQYKQPDDPDVLPPADAMVVAPATFSTVNKLAHGISDTLALGLLNEAIGMGLPIIVVPWPNIHLARHPAFERSVSDLRAWGVTVVYDPASLPDAAPEPAVFPWRTLEAELMIVGRLRELSAPTTRDHGASRPAGRPRLGRMDTGVAIFPTHDAIAPADVARLAEERGHESLFFPEHTHIPAGRQTPHPSGSALPRRYAHTVDLFVAVTAAITVTSRLRVGSGICLVVERDPITTAKEVASVDYLSGGRFEFGVGAGWNREEMANHGTDPRRRMAIMRERIEAMKAIWTSEEASYDGQYVAFERIWSWPKPAQHPHPPVLVGGNGPGVLDRVLAFGDAWFPNHEPEGILDRAAELRARADRPVALMVMGAPADPEVLEAYANAGFRRAVHWLPSAPRGPVERAMDRWESAVAQLNGE